MFDEGSDEYKIIMLNKRYLSFRVIKVSGAVSLLQRQKLFVLFLLFTIVRFILPKFVGES